MIRSARVARAMQRSATTGISIAWGCVLRRRMLLA
jgi:hypothetical protein